MAGLTPPPCTGVKVTEVSHLRNGINKMQETFSSLMGKNFQNKIIPKILHPSDKKRVIT